MPLTNGDTATGSFVFDADTATYSNILVSLNGNDYDALVAGNADFGQFARSGDLPGLNGDALLSLKFANPLTSGGGTVAAGDSTVAGLVTDERDEEATTKQVKAAVRSVTKSTVRSRRASSGSAAKSSRAFLTESAVSSLAQPFQYFF